MTRTAIELDNHRLTQPTTAAEMPWGTWGYVSDPRGRTVVTRGSIGTLPLSTEVSPVLDLSTAAFQLHRDAEGEYHARFFRECRSISALTDPLDGPFNCTKDLCLASMEAYGAGESRRILVTEARRTGQLSLVAMSASTVAWEMLRWRLAETLEAIAYGIDTLAQKAKP